MSAQFMTIQLDGQNGLKDKGERNILTIVQPFYWHSVFI